MDELNMHTSFLDYIIATKFTGINSVHAQTFAAVLLIQRVIGIIFFLFKYFILVSSVISLSFAFSSLKKNIPASIIT